MARQLMLFIYLHESKKIVVEDSTPVVEKIQNISGEDHTFIPKTISLIRNTQYQVGYINSVYAFNIVGYFYFRVFRDLQLCLIKICFWNLYSTFG